MRPADEQRNPVGRRTGQVLTAESPRQKQQCGIPTGRSRHGHAPWGAARPCPSGRHRDGGQIQQVHEIRVATQRGIREKGIGQIFRDGVEAGRGGQQQDVDGIPDRFRSACELAEPILRFEGCRCVPAFRRLENCPRHRENGLRISLHEIPDRGPAFSHPRAFVEELGRFGEWRQVNCDGRAADRFHSFHRRGEESRRVGITREIEGPGHAESKGFRIRFRWLHLAGENIPGIINPHHLRDQQRVGGMICKNGNAV